MTDEIVDSTQCWTYRLVRVAAVTLTVLEVKRLLVLTYEILVNSRAIRFAGALLPVLLSLFDFGLGFPIAIASVKVIRNKQTGWGSKMKVQPVYSRTALSRISLVLVLCIFLNTATLVLMFTLRIKLGRPNRMRQLFNASMGLYSSDVGVKVTLDELQMDLECCGFSGYANWFGIDWQGIDINAGYADNVEARRSVPFSCCDRQTLYPCVHSRMRKDDEMTINSGGCSPLIHRVIFKISLFTYVMTGLVLLTQIITIILLRRLSRGNKAYRQHPQEVIREIDYTDTEKDKNLSPPLSRTSSTPRTKSAACSCCLYLEERARPPQKNLTRSIQVDREDYSTCYHTEDYEDEDDEDEESAMTPGKLRELLSELRDDMQHPDAKKKKNKNKNKFKPQLLGRESLSSSCSYEGSSTSSGDCDF